MVNNDIYLDRVQNVPESEEAKNRPSDDRTHDLGLLASWTPDSDGDSYIPVDVGMRMYRKQNHF